MFVECGLRLEWIEEPDERDYPYISALRLRGTRRARQHLGLAGVLRSDRGELSVHRGGHDGPTLDEYSNLSSYERRVA
jgi:hypothetical protein